MKAFLIRKLLYILPTLFTVTVVTFSLLYVTPGDPVQLLLGERGASVEAVQEMRSLLGLDKSIGKQYLLFLKSIFQGDFGHSIVTSESVSKEFFSYFPATFELTFFALLWAFILGIPLGVFAAFKKNTLLDHSIIGLSLFGFSMSIFWWGIILILIFSVGLGITPVSGRVSVLYDIPFVTGLYLIDSWFSEDGKQAFLSALNHLLLPSLVLGTIPLAFIVRMTRSSVLETLSKDFIRTAKSKGLSFYQVFFHHAFVNALVPIITVIGFLVGTLLTGAILTETVFSWPGVGQWLVQAVLSRDYPVIKGGVLLISFIIIGINMMIDIIYTQIDPKIRDLLLKKEVIK